MATLELGYGGAGDTIIPPRFTTFDGQFEDENIWRKIRDPYDAVGGLLDTSDKILAKIDRETRVTRSLGFAASWLSVAVQLSPFDLN